MANARHGETKASLECTSGDIGEAAEARARCRAGELVDECAVALACVVCIYYSGYGQQRIISENENVFFLLLEH